MKEEDTNTIIKQISDELKKSRPEKSIAQIVSVELEKQPLQGFFVDKESGIKVEFLGDCMYKKVRTAEGVELFARAWDKKGKPIGFGAGGRIEIERFRIISPSFLVEDKKGDVVKTSIHPTTGEEIVERFRIDPLQCIKEDVVHAIKQSGKNGDLIRKGSVGNTTTTINATLDGNLRNTPTSSGTWAKIHDNLTGSVLFLDTTYLYIQITSTSSGVWQHMIRGYMVFDTSVIADSDTITGATFSLNYRTTEVGAKNNDYSSSIGVVAYSGSLTSPATGDYVNFGTTRYATDIAMGSIAAAGTYTDWTLNSTGYGAITKTGKTGIGIRISQDLDNAEPAGQSGTKHSTIQFESHSNGGSKPPKLVVTSTSLPTQFKVGTYTGNGGTSGTRAITGIGFKPKFVLVWSADTSEIYPMWNTQSAITGLGASGAFLGENGWNTNSQYDRFNSFDDDGFTISIGSQTGASFKALNKNSLVFYYLAIGGSDTYSGTYAGNNTDNRNITGVGFQPELVWLMGGNRHAVFKTSATGSSTDTASNMYNGADATNKIQALQSDGFQVGTSVEANENAVNYYYFAMKSNVSIVTGQYTGNGSDNRDITAVGWLPEFVFIKGTSTQNNVLRSTDHSGDLSKYYRSSGFAANYIQSLISTGFQVGTASDVNTNSAVYSYIAMRTYVNVTTVGITKSLAYSIKITPTALTKSLKYCVKITPSAKTKSLQYCVKTTPSAKTKSLQYAVKPTTALTKTLKYTVVITPSAKTKSLQYAVKTTPSAITKSLQYLVKPTTSVTKSLKYCILTVPSAKTKSLQYTVKPTTSITKSLQYCVRATPSAKTKSVQYAVKYTPSAKTKSLQYEVKVVSSLTKSLKYTVKITPSAKTKTSQYAVKTIPSAKTKSLRYVVLYTPSALTKTLKYTVKITPSAKTKNLQYEVKVVTALTKSLQYGIKTTPSAKTKSLKYVVKITPSALTKSLRYGIRKSNAITKSLQYRISGTAPALTKQLKYIVVQRWIVTKSLQYVVLRNVYRKGTNRYGKSNSYGKGTNRYSRF